MSMPASSKMTSPSTTSSNHSDNRAEFAVERLVVYKTDESVVKGGKIAREREKTEAELPRLALPIDTKKRTASQRCTSLLMMKSLFCRSCGPV